MRYNTECLAFCYITECIIDNVISLNSQFTCYYITECSVVILVITRNLPYCKTCSRFSQTVTTGNVILVSSGYPSQLFLCSYREFPLAIRLVDRCHSNICDVNNPICTVVSLYPRCDPWSSQL